MPIETNILELPDDTTTEIFAALGPNDTARCAMVCSQWWSVSNESGALWRHFVYKDFSLSDGDMDSEWRLIYGYLASRILSAPFHSKNKKVAAAPLPASLVFADDDHCFPGYPPENALKATKKAWCTNVGVNENVDLVVELKCDCLITGFAAANGGLFYSCPLNEALVFASMTAPDLDEARLYDGDKGSEWVKQLEQEAASRKNTLDRSTGRYYELEIPTSKQTTSSKVVEPLAAFQFPSNFEECCFAKLQIPCAPTTGRYVHFKLLRSCHPPGIPHNIDVKDLHVLGVVLPDLPALLQQPATGKACFDPKYQGIHKKPTDLHILHGLYF